MPGYPTPLNFGLFDNWLAGVLHVDIFFGSMVAMAIIALAFLLPMFLMKANSYIMIVSLIFLSVVFTAVGWIGAYIWVFVALYLAFVISGKIRNGL